MSRFALFCLLLTACIEAPRLRMHRVDEAVHEPDAGSISDAGPANDGGVSTDAGSSDFDQCPPRGVVLRDCEFPGVELFGSDSNAFIWNRDGESGREVTYKEGLLTLCNTPCRRMGRLRLSEVPSIRSLEELKPITRFHEFGKLVLEFSQLEDLRGLSNELQIDELELYFNQRLTSLEGLEGLTRARRIYLDGNHKLADIAALGNVTEVDDLIVSSNPSLRSLKALSNVSRAEWIHISNCDGLTSIGAFNHHTHMQKSLQIGGNDALTDLDAFAMLRSSDIGVFINENPKLKACQIEELVSRLADTTNVVVEQNSSEAPPCE